MSRSRLPAQDRQIVTFVNRASKRIQIRRQGTLVEESQDRNEDRPRNCGWCIPMTITLESPRLPGPCHDQTESERPSHQRGQKRSSTRPEKHLWQV